MKTFEKLSRELRELTDTIQEPHPELVKYMDELPISVPAEKGRKKDLELLEEYRDSLRSILSRYTQKNPKN